VLTATIQVDTREVEEAIRRLGDRAPFAIARALNKAGSSGVTAGVRAVSKDTGIKQADLKGTTKRNRRIWSSDAHPGNLVTTIYCDADRIPLYDFGARQTKKGVTARVRPGSRRLYPHLFVATVGKGGHVGVFGRDRVLTRRSPKAWGPNLPITERRGPSIAYVWKQHERTVIDRVNEQLPKTLASELAFEMRRQRQKQ
jgi:hypothetical protein